MYRILLILYIIWGGVSIASGQDFNYSFTQLSTNQGLSQASVTSVTMDQKGRLWIGTQSGLNYYFGSPDKPGGLSIQLCKSEKKEFYIRYSS